MSKTSGSLQRYLGTPLSAGVCGLLVGHPLDTIKVRQQNLGTTMFVSIGRTFRHEGIKGFYKGLLFPLITIGPSNAVFFGVYGNSMKLLIKDETQVHQISPTDTLTIEKIFIAGAVAGVFQALCTCPVELIKTVLQSKTGKKGSWKKHYEVTYTGPWSAFKGILKERKISGLYRGVVPMMLRDVPTSGLYVVTYEMLLYSYWADTQMPQVMKQMLAGGIAGVVSWVPALPLDVVKTRMQSENPDDPLCKGMFNCFKILHGRGGIVSWLLVIPVDVVKSRIQADNPSNPLYRGMIDCFVKSYKTEGLAVFGKGLPAIVIRAFPVNAAIFVGYEFTYKLFRNNTSFSQPTSAAK